MVDRNTKYSKLDDEEEVDVEAGNSSNHNSRGKGSYRDDEEGRGGDTVEEPESIEEEEQQSKHYLQDHNTHSEPSGDPLPQRRRQNPAKKLRGHFETLLVYGYILEAVAAFTCLLVLFNVVVLSNKIHKADSDEPSEASIIVVRVFGALAYGITVYVGIVTQLVALSFLYVMIRTRFKYNQAGVPKPDTTYANIVLGAHVIIGLHWLAVSIWLFLDAGYIDCFQVTKVVQSSLGFIIKFHRLCDLVWLVKFLSALNLLIWSSLSLFLAVFVNHFFIAFVLRLFPFLRKYSFVNELLHAVDYFSPSGSRQASLYPPLSGY